MQLWGEYRQLVPMDGRVSGWQEGVPMQCKSRVVLASYKIAPHGSGQAYALRLGERCREGVLSHEHLINQHCLVTQTLKGSLQPRS